MGEFRVGPWDEGGDQNSWLSQSLVLGIWSLAKKMGILPFTYWVLLTTYIFFAYLEIVMCLKHIEASHIMAFNS